jgi:hypothetical protein
MACGRICSETVFCRLARGFIVSILPSSMTLFESRSGLDNAAGDRKPLRVSPFRLNAVRWMRSSDSAKATLSPRYK